MYGTAAASSRAGQVLHSTLPAPCCHLLGYIGAALMLMCRCQLGCGEVADVALPVLASSMGQVSPMARLAWGRVHNLLISCVFALFHGAWAPHTHEGCTHAQTRIMI